MVKPQKERLKESIHLLKQLKDHGINEEEPGYLEIKAKMTEWIRDGDSYSGAITLVFFDRICSLVLPTADGRVATLHLKAVSRVDGDES